MDMLNNVLGCVGMITLLCVLDAIITDGVFTTPVVTKLKYYIERLRTSYLSSTNRYIGSLRDMEWQVVNVFAKYLNPERLHVWKVAYQHRSITSEIEKDKALRREQEHHKGIKIVINELFGGFAISEGGLEWLSNNGRTVDLHGWLVSDDRNIPRHDPVLVKMVETLGEAASATRGSSLVVLEIPGNQYLIRDHDGKEEVCTPENMNWVKVG